MRKYFNRRIAIPQDHGAWVFLLSPLLIGLFAGCSFRPGSAFLIAAAQAAFLIRQPVTVAVKAWSGRRPRQDLPVASFWIAVYALIGLTALAGLVGSGNGFVLYLAAPGLPVFAWHLYLVSQRSERKQAGVEILATGVLALAAPAAFWTGCGIYDPTGWTLWLLTWLQSAASIVYAYLRLSQRVLPGLSTRAEQWRLGRRALLYTTFNLALALVGALFGLLPSLIFIPFLLQWLETLWGITHPAVGASPTQIGLRQLLISTFFTILFVLVWRLA
ncbi:MAG: YwiC-like family protein [Anaerolineales bacterium]|nr:YwiC-like family protein [Anaerolineales bacterium]